MSWVAELPKKPPLAVHSFTTGVAMSCGRDDGIVHWERSLQLAAVVEPLHSQ